MNVRFFRRFGIPAKGAPRKINADFVLCKQRFPQSGNLLALRNGVCGNECGFYVRALHHRRRFKIPACNVVNIVRNVGGN